MNVQEASEIRELSIDELDDVNGGIIPLLAMAICFGSGLVAGAIAANYAYIGNFWGDIGN
jgi:lactobin A/cerein 7B family class IIb bacteriocin